MQTYTIGNITFDNLLCVSLKKEVFLKLPLIKKYVYYDEYFDMLLKSLKHVHEKPTNRILDSISATNDNLVQHFGSRINQEKETVYYSSVLWEWFYLLLYYVHQLDQDPQWQENYLPHAKAFQIRSICIEETKKGEALIDQFIAKRQRVLETQKHLQQPVASEKEESSAQEEAYISQIAQLQEQLAQKDARIAELEALLDHPHLSFIETEGKSPDKIRWAYEDIKKATGAPAKMADCLVDLQHKDMLKGQERYGKLKGIKSIYDELKNAYGITWTYAALCKVIKNRNSNKNATK